MTLQGLTSGEEYCIRVGAVSGRETFFSAPTIVRAAAAAPSPPLSLMTSPGQSQPPSRGPGTAPTAPLALQTRRPAR